MQNRTPCAANLYPSVPYFGNGGFVPSLSMVTQPMTTVNLNVQQFYLQHCKC